MVDLVQEFFKRDLTEAEHEALSKLLECSPEAASGYERLLEQNYLATGLPQPTLPKGLQSLPHHGAGGLTGLGSSIKIFLAVLAVSGIALWKFWPQTKAEISMPVQQPVQQILEKHLTTNVKPLVKKPAPIQPSAAEPTQEGQELSVVVNAPQRSLVTVRILDPAGKEVRALYTGFVEPGRWNFKWDGLLGNGELAGAGDYRIDVQTGEAHQTKDIWIKLRQPAS